MKSGTQQARVEFVARYLGNADVPWAIEHQRSRGTGPTAVQVRAKVLDGWELEITFVAGPDGPVVQEFRLASESLGAPPLGSRLLRKAGLGHIEDEFASLLRSDLILRHLLGPDWEHRIDRPGRAGRPDGDYLEWARKYVAALERDPRKPIQVMLADAEAAGDYLTEAQLRALVNRARARKLLTPAPKGRAGGDLTETAHKLIREQERHAELLHAGRSF